MRTEFTEVAREIRALPPELEAKLSQRLAAASNGFLARLGLGIQTASVIPGDGDLAVDLLAIEIAGAVRTGYRNDELADALAIIPDAGELWTALRAACAEDVVLAELADITMILED